MMKPKMKAFKGRDGEIESYLVDHAGVRVWFYPDDVTIFNGKMVNHGREDDKIGFFIFKTMYEKE